MVREWRDVSMDEFFSVIGPMDVHPYPQGKWPYTSLFKTRSGFVVGKAEDFLPEGSGLTETRYWLPMEGQ